MEAVGGGLAQRAVITRSAFVVPGWLNGTPAVTTTSSPGLAKPSARARRPARDAASVMELTTPVMTACTPHTSAKRRAVARLGVSPSTGHSGRSRATRSAVLPPSVKAAMAAAPTVSATWRAAAAMASGLRRSGAGRLAAVMLRGQREVADDEADPVPVLRPELLNVRVERLAGFALEVQEFHESDLTVGHGGQPPTVGAGGDGGGLIC